MSLADDVYRKSIHRILSEGVWDTDQSVRPRWADGTPAHTIGVIGEHMVFGPDTVPILTIKEVKWQAAIKELLWIWVQKSNRVQDLRDQGVRIWDPWEQSDGTIGHAYGYVLQKKVRRLHGEMVDQVTYLLDQLTHNPASRRLIVSLWDITELDQMRLTPCVYETQWLVKEGQLHLVVSIRSNDMGVGHPFNVFQYGVLHRMVAQVTGLSLGNMHVDIRDAHLYDRHVESVSAQLALPAYPQPSLWINPHIKKWEDFTPNDFALHDYQHGPFCKLEVAE